MRFIIIRYHYEHKYTNRHRNEINHPYHYFTSLLKKSTKISERFAANTDYALTKRATAAGEIRYHLYTLHCNSVIYLMYYLT